MDDLKAKSEMVKKAQAAERMKMLKKNLDNKIRSTGMSKDDAKAKPDVQEKKRKAKDLKASADEDLGSQESEEEDEKTPPKKVQKPPPKVSSPGQAVGTGVKKMSELFGPETWPFGMSAAAVDQLTLEQFLKAKELSLSERKLRTDDPDLPGQIMEATAIALPEVEVAGGFHDFIKNLCPGSLLHLPIGPALGWWHLLPVAWLVPTSEYGTDERGCAGRVSKSTWISAHNRK